MAGKAEDRLNELQTAAQEYFTSEKNRLSAQYDFLDSISKKRGGNAGLRDANAEGASKILVDSINDYLGRAVSPKDEP
jgi:hypothetical protein